jgi:hypothetical protein
MNNKPIKYAYSLAGIITLINLVFIILFSLLWQNNSTHILIKLAYYLLCSVFSSVIISIFVISTAPVLKDFLATFRQLLRLENLSHPLMLKLSLEAPGTYHHSLSVANIASRAAKSIGADPLLTRVGSYYHDIGKTLNPEYFIENQKEGTNPHDEIQDPKKSFEILQNHVCEGIKLAQEYHIPNEVIAFIAEHQGTQLSFFYNIAFEKNKKTKKDDYRYNGPKPLSKESAIVMMADTIEAKVRLLDKVNLPNIQNIINETVDEKISDNQFDLSGLNSKDIEKIKNSFIDTLSVMYHQRIEYKNGFKTNFKELGK